MSEARTVPDTTGDLKSQPGMGEHAEHFARCGACGWVGPESEMIPDPEGHPCGKDECPSCHAPWCISCCYPTYEAAESGEMSAEEPSPRDGQQEGR